MKSLQKDYNWLNTNQTFLIILLSFTFISNVFGSAIRFSTGYTIRKIEYADMDGNGTTDIVGLGYLNQTYELAWFKNNSEGKFSKKINILTSTNNNGLNYFDLIDFDSDGDVDILYSEKVYNDITNIYLLENNGDGIYEKLQFYSQKGSMQNFFITDYDNDNDFDIISFSVVSEFSYFHENKGAGKFAAGVSIGNYDEPSYNVNEDIDKDGIKDEFAISEDNTKIVLYLKDEMGNIKKEKILRMIPNISYPKYSPRLNAVDVDLDGDIDLFYENNGQIFWATNDGKGNYPYFGFDNPKKGESYYKQHIPVSVFIAEELNPTSSYFFYSLDGGKNYVKTNQPATAQSLAGGISILPTDNRSIFPNTILKLASFDESYTYGISDTFILINKLDDIFYSDIQFLNKPDNKENAADVIIPGKPLRFNIEAKNNHPQNLLTLYGNIECNDPKVSITDNRATFNNIETGQKAWSVDPFEIVIDPATPPNTLLHFELTIRDEILIDSVWTSYFIIEVLPLAKPITYDFYQLSTFEKVTPSLQNPGNVIASDLPIRFKLRSTYLNGVTNLTALLTSEDEYINITDSLSVNGDELEFTYSGNPPDNKLNFNIHYCDPQHIARTWKQEFAIPLINISKYLINDDNFHDSKGNGNGEINPNEVIEFLPFFKNLTEYSFDSAYVTLESDDVQVWDGFEIYGFDSTYNKYLVTGMEIRPYKDKHVTLMDFVFNVGKNTNPVLTLLFHANIDEPIDDHKRNMPGGLPARVNYQLPVYFDNKLVKTFPLIHRKKDDLDYSGISKNYSLYTAGLAFYDNVNPHPDNPRNVISPNKPFRFKITLSSPDYEFRALKAFLHSSNPQIIVTDSMATINNFMKGFQPYDPRHANQPHDEFEILFSDTLPNGTVDYSIRFEEPYIENGIWYDEIKIPILTNPRFLIDDDDNPDSFGDNDDNVEPGETIEIIPLLKSESNAMFFKPIGKLFSDYCDIRIWNDTLGASGIVSNTWRYNMVNNSHDSIFRKDNVTPEFDYVFDYMADEVFETKLTLEVTTYYSRYLKMIFQYPIVFNMGAEKRPIEFMSPPDSSVYHLGDTIYIQLETREDNTQPVSFYINSVNTEIQNIEPYIMDWFTADSLTGNYSISAKVEYQGMQYCVKRTIFLIEPLTEVKPTGTPTLPKAVSDNKLMVYPNPTNDKVRLENYSIEDIKKLTVKDLSGTILKVSTTLGQGNNEISIPWSPGVYILYFELSGNRTEVVKLIKF